MEEWRPAVGFPDYAVSDAGNFMRIVPSPGRGSFAGVAGRTLRASPQANGYFRVFPMSGSYGNRKVSTVLIHRAVALAFKSRPTGCDEVNHINGNKADNRAENLEWVTKRENTRHAVRFGLYSSGFSHYKAKIPFARVEEIRSEYIRGASIRDIAKRHGLSRACATGICLGKTRVHG